MEETISLIPLKFLEKPGEKYNPEIVKEVRRLALVYARHLHRGKTPISFIAEQTAAIARVLYALAEERGADLKALETDKDIRRMIRKSVGLTEIYQWLDTKGEKAEKILKESGSQKLFVDFWKFYYNQGTFSYYQDIQIWKKKIQDLKSWFKVVDFLITHSSFKHRENLTDTRRDLVFWKKKVVFSSFLISFTLGIDRPIFSLEEIERFLRRVDDFDSWWKELREKIADFPADSGVQELFESEEMLVIIGQLKTPANRTILNFAEHLPLLKTDRELLRELRVIFEAAVNYGLNRPDELPKQTQLARARANVSKIFSELRTKLIHQFILSKTAFLFWLSEDNLAEVLVYDSFSAESDSRAGNLTKFAHELEILSPNLEKVVTGKFLVGEIFRAALERREPLVRLSTWIEKNRKFKDRKWAPGWENRLEEEVFAAVSRELSLPVLNDWLQMLETETKIDPVILPTPLCLAVYLENFLVDKPKSVVAHISSKDWGLYVSNQAFQQFFIKRAKRGPTEDN